MLDQKLQDQLKAYLSRLTRRVEITASLDESEHSQSLSTLLKQIVSFSPLISLREDGQQLRRPSFCLSTPEAQINLQFAGIPLGHEFSSLVLALLQVGGHPVKASPEQIARIESIETPLNFESYISLSCQNCPDVVQALNLFTILNPLISHTMIDGALYQDEIDSRKIMAVPTVYLNDNLFGQGRMSLDEILDKVDDRGAKRIAEALSQQAPFDILVVGAGPAGATAAIYAARKGLRTGLVAERLGGQVLETLAIENFISVKSTQGSQLATALEAHVREYDVEVMANQMASSLKPIDAHRNFHEVNLASGASLRAKTLIIATGARWRQMNVPGEQDYASRGVAYCPHCDGTLFKGKKVAVIGGGNSGVEAAIDLANVVSHVTLLEFDHKLRADAVLQRKLNSLQNVTILTSAQTTEVLGDGQKVIALQYLNRLDHTEHRVDVSGIFVQIGLLPNSQWLSNALRLSDRGEILIDERGQTSQAGIFAAGDVTTVPYKQIVIALGEGAKASLSAFDYLIRQDENESLTQSEEQVI